METALTKFHEAAGIKADEVLDIAPIGCAAIAPSERRPVMVAGRVIDMVQVESLARIGLTYEEVLRKLRLKPTDMMDRPDVEAEIREACDAGSIDLIENFKRDLVALSAENPASNMFALKALCPEQYDDKVRRDKSKQSGQNAQDVLNGLVQMMIERNRIQNDEIRNAIAEQRAISQSNLDAIQRQKMPRLGQTNENTGRPVVTVEPIEQIADALDEIDQQAKREELADTSSADAVKKTMAQLSAQRADSEHPNE
jgi:hypothetical protein